MNRHQRQAMARVCSPWARVCLAGVAAVITTIGQAQEAKPDPQAQTAPSASVKKEIVQDTGPTASPSARGRLVPTAQGNPPQASATPAPAAASAPVIYNTALHDGATSAALADLGLSLLRQGSRSSGNGQVNAVVSPLSMAAALGLVHAGTSGAGASELAGLLEPSTAAGRIFSRRLPAALDRLWPKDGGGPSPFVMANRVWVDANEASAVPPTYAALVSERFNSDGAIVAFADAEASRNSINQWVAQQTANRIPELMPQGSVTPTTKVVVTNAIHFKSRWAEPFDPAKTVPQPFHLSAGATKPVPTMIDERAVRKAVVDNLEVMELPFAGHAFTLMLAMAPVGHTLNALETDLAGLDIASWSSQLKPVTCRLELPRFAIAPRATALKPALQALGVRAVFSQGADFSPLLGKAAEGVYLNDVYQSATVVIDEEGGEAAAATGAAIQLKSFSMPAPTCAINRPFLFAVMHKPTGTPLFVGKVADPTAR